MKECIKKIREMSSWFEDDLSRDTFWVRFQYEIEGYSLRMREKLESVYDEIAYNEVNGKYPIGVIRQYEYFRFPERYKKNTAMVDCGCYDARESKYFSKWSDGHYTKIYAFEPNPDSATVSRDNLKGLNAELFQVALSDVNNTGELFVENQWKSYLTKSEYDFGRNKPDEFEKKEYIEMRKLDDIVNEEVGFIKLQAMGGEYNALKGAQRIIETDKPMISLVIDRFDQLVAIMLYLHDLVHEYRFHFRQYYDVTKGRPGRCILIASVCDSI